MTTQELIWNFWQSAGGLITSLLFLLFLLLFIFYQLFKRHIMPKVTGIFSTLEKLDKSVDQLGLITKEVKLESDFIKRENKENREAIKRIDDSIERINIKIDNLSIEISTIIEEHLKNHPPSERIKIKH